MSLAKGGQPVSHTKVEKVKLLNRVRRVRGQIEAVERALENEKGCATVLHLIVAARGAMNSLMTEVIEDHIRLHVVDPVKDAERSRGAEELIEAVPRVTATSFSAKATSVTNGAPGW
jgi:DNA-binding FrmR family transcriptional regulator